MNQDTSAPAESVYVPYGAIVKQLLESNRRIRERVAPAMSITTHSHAHWYREHCTVRIGAARQSGLTHAIAELLIPKTLVIVRDQALKEVVYHRCISRLKEINSDFPGVHDMAYALEPATVPDNRMIFPIATMHDIRESFKQRPRETVHITLDDDDEDPHATVELHLAKLRAQVEAKRRRTGHYVRFIVDAASFVFEKFPIKDFYRWAHLNAQGDSPEFIFLG